MATYNAFNLLTDFTSDDPSLLACDRLRSENPPKVDRPTPAPRFLPLKKCREIKDQDSDHLLESGFRKKFGPSGDRQIEKGAFDGNIRGVVNKGVKRNLVDDANSELYGPKLEAVDKKSEDSFKVSVKHRLHVHRGLAGRSLARKMSGAKRGVPWKGSRWWVENEYLEFLESKECAYEDLDDFLSDNTFEEQVIGTLIEDHESDNKLTLEQYGKVMEEKKQVLQATLQEISAKRQEEEDFINEFVIIDAEDDEFEAEEMDDFLLV